MSSAALSRSRPSAAGRGRRTCSRRSAAIGAAGIDRAEFDRVADEAVRRAAAPAGEAGCDIVTDGELRRDNFYSFVAEKLAGVRLMTLAEMLDVVEDKAGFERLLQTLDVPAYSISNPICVGRIERREPLAVDDLRVRAAATPTARSRSRCPVRIC